MKSLPAIKIVENIIRHALSKCPDYMVQTRINEYYKEYKYHANIVGDGEKFDKLIKKLFEESINH